MPTALIIDITGQDSSYLAEFLFKDEKFYRPAEVDLLISDPSKARTVLKWAPTVSFKQLVTMMVDSDLARQSRDDLFLNHVLRVKSVV